MKTLTIIFVVAFIISVVRISHEDAPIAGPFDIIWKTISQCSRIQYGQKRFFYEVKLHRHSRTYRSAKFNLSMQVPLSDKIKVSSNIAVKTNQGWKENFHISQSVGVCYHMKSLFPSNFKNIIQQFGVSDCPIAAGNYSVEVDMNITTVIKSFFYNDFKGRVIGKNNDGIVFCADYEFSSVPKKDGH